MTYIDSYEFINLGSRGLWNDDNFSLWINL
jgi:hypothetical protein